MYVTPEQITTYLRRSQHEGKMVIATDACGAGKTDAMLAWVAANPDWSVVMVVERKEQAQSYRTRLVTAGVPAHDIAVVTSDEPAAREAKYAAGAEYSKRICLITHARLWMDPPQLWRSYRFSHGTILLIDEILLDTVRSVRINIGFLTIMSTYIGFDITKYRNCFDDTFDPQELRSITPADQETILRYLSVLYGKLVDAAQQGHDVKGDILEGMSEPETVDAILDRPERVAYVACLITYSVLMGKVREVPGSHVRTVSVISPLLLWSHEFEAAVLFDGTGELFPYPKDSCVLMPPTVQPRPLVNVKLLAISGAKPWHLHRVKQDPIQYYTTLRAQLTQVVMALATQYARVYICTWRDKEPAEFEHRTSRWYSAEIAEEIIVHIHNRPQFEIEPVLKLEALLRDIACELQLTERVTVSHYGLSRGSNAFQAYDCVLLVGLFYYPSWKYKHYATFSAVYSLIKQRAVPTYNENPLPLVLSYLIQEAMRTQARRGTPVDCYVCMERSESDYAQIIEGVEALQEAGYYVNSLEATDLDGSLSATALQVKFQYMLQQSLTKKQVERMIQLVKAYPSLLDERSLTIDTPALGQLWGCRSNDVCTILQSIMDRSESLITYRVLEQGTPGRKQSTIVQIELRSVASSWD